MTTTTTTKTASGSSTRPRRPRTLREYLDGPPRISQRRLAQLVGCGQPMISMLAQGKRVANGALALRLHKQTGVPLKAFLKLK